MYCKLFYILLIAQIFSNSTATEIAENSKETNLIRHHIGIPDDFYAQNLFTKLGTKYYYISRNEKVTWYTAMHRCHSIGGHLINLTDNATLNEVSEVIKKKNNSNYWTDLSNLSESGDYISMMTGQKSSYFNWCDLDTKKINPIENCVYIENLNTFSPCMKPISCIQFMSYVCESNIPRTIEIVAW